MSILVWIALGLVGGLAAGWFLGWRGRLLLGDAVVGVIGALIGGFLAAIFLGLDIAQIDGTSVLVAAFGAALLILVLHSLTSTDVYE